MAHALTIFISAFLLFLVQLIVGKRILPWFGGAPAVWTTCMLFFQVLLLLGYAYAHLLSARFSPSVQARIHSVLLLLSLAVVGVCWWQWGSPILPDDSWKPKTPDDPVWNILKLLAVSVGLPFLLLSSTSPLIQRWFSFESENERTYRLYALSNVGSILALLSYPFFIEPWTSLPTQGKTWGIGYLVFIGGCLACAASLFRLKEIPVSTPSIEETYQRRPGTLVIAIWILLGAVTSGMLLAVTNNLCQEVAVVPFLWVFPLLIYLLTFVICFENPRWYVRRWYAIATATSTIVVLITAFQGVQLKIVAHIISYGTFLFLFCMTCHGEIVRLKPPTKFLTLFYLSIALGGAIGALFVGVVAPLLYDGYYEFHFLVLTGWIVLALAFGRDKTSFFFTGDRLHLLLLVMVFSYFTVRLVFIAGFQMLPKSDLIPLLISGAITALFGVLTFRTRFVLSKYWPRILVGAVIFFAECFLLNRMRSSSVGTLDISRNFYGVTRVEHRLMPGTNNLSVVQLSHGQINHGIQFTDETWFRQPVGYYSPNSGAGMAFRFHPRRDASPQLPLNVGLLGLGVGTLAAYGRQEDTFRFYEINPVVARYSRGEKPFFTYLSNFPGNGSVIMGDARVSLERELADNNANQFDILLMDAFSSDSVPVHLLTREAFAIYLKHLRDEDSIIAINISNRFLDFRDLMVETGKTFGLEAVIIDCQGDPPDRTVSRWCVLTQSKAFLERPEVQQAKQVFKAERKIIWTDDFSNLFRLLK